MRTDDLISALAADNATRVASPERFAAAWLPVAVLVSIVVFAVLLGLRPDLATAVHTWRFNFKFGITLLVAATACWLVLRMARPGADEHPPILALLVAPGLLLAAVVYELLVMPSAEWVPTMIGQNWLVCLTTVPILSMPPLAALLIALKRGAPTSPERTGAVAGLVAAGLGATLYAARCTDDSPLFVVIWYSIAAGMVSLAGMLIGRWLLRW